MFRAAAAAAAPFRRVSAGAHSRLPFGRAERSPFRQAVAP